METMGPMAAVMKTDYVGAVQRVRKDRLSKSKGAEMKLKLKGSPGQVIRAVHKMAGDIYSANGRAI